MATDISFYDTKQPEPYNPLKTIGDLQAINNAQQQGQYAQGQNRLQQAKIRMNEIFAQNTDENGHLDVLKAIGQGAKDQVAAPAIPNAIEYGNALTTPVSYLDSNNQQMLRSQYEQAQEYNKNPNNPLQAASQQQTQAQSAQQAAPTQEQLDQVHDHFNYLGDAITGLIKKPGGATTSDIINTVADANAEYVKSGGKRGLSTQEATGVLGTIPAGQNGGEATPAELTPWLQQNLAHVRGMQGAVTAAHGAPSSAQQNDMNSMATPTATRRAALAPGKEKQIANAVADQATIDDEAKRATAAKPALQHMYDLSIRGAETGTASEKINNIYGALVSFGLATPGIKETNKQISELAKYANQNVQGQGGNDGTNKQLEALNSANVNIEQAPEIFQTLLRSGLAQTQSKIGLQNALRNQLGTNPDPDKNRAFINNWNNHHDQRVIEYALTPDDKKADYLKTVPIEQIPAFRESYKYLKSVNALPH